ncbi:MAG: hypothetical protein K2X34_03465 [Hyphomonadaceae bacterium]|nr:hypothetical protein [Hyphomonadaceae bacterium]
MFDRAMATVIATSAACAAAVMAVFSLGFALYALILPTVGPPGAAAIVALVATLGVALFALFAAYRRRQKEEEAAALQAQLLEQAPGLGLGDIARERPIVTLAITALGGLLAARHPALARDLLSLVARFGRR